MKVDDNSSLKVLIIFAHPNKDSLNGSILEKFIEGLSKNNVEYKVRDLNLEKFDPVYTKIELENSYRGIVPEFCQKEQQYLLWANTLVWIYPCWNFSMPAILKGYIDKVFLIPNFSFSSDAKGTEYFGGLFSDKKALIIQTLGGSIDRNRKEIGKHPFVHDLILSMSYAGIKKLHIKQFENIYSFASKQHSEIKQILKTSYCLGASIKNLSFDLEDLI